MSDHNRQARAQLLKDSEGAELHMSVRQVRYPLSEVEVPTVFRYQVDDPFAVTVDFLSEDGSATSWTFARELLDVDEQAPTGRGDVRAWISQDGPEAAEMLVLRLEASAGYALLEVDLEAIRCWLGCAYELVPRGAEGAHVDWDRMARALLDG